MSISYTHGKSIAYKYWFRIKEILLCIHIEKNGRSNIPCKLQAEEKASVELLDIFICMMKLVFSKLNVDFLLKYVCTIFV